MLSSYMLFMAQPGVTELYLWFWLLVIYAGFSIATLAQLAWAAVLSPNYDERSRIYGFWQAGNVIGMILVLMLPALLPMVGVKGHAAGVAAMGWFIVILLPVFVGLALWQVPEPQVVTKPHHAGLKEYVALLKRPTVVRILAADLLIGAGPAIAGVLFFFFFERVKDFEKSAASGLLLAYFIGGLVGAPVWTWLSYRIGKHKALAVSGVVYAVMAVSVLAVPPGNFLAAAILMFLIGVPYAAGAFLLRAMMADIGDEERLDSGVDRTGLLYALLSGTVKIGSAAAVGASFPLLQALGFNPLGGSSATGLTALAIMFSIVPAVMGLISSAIIIGFPLTAERHAVIRDALAQRDLADAAPEMASEPLIAEEIHVAARPAE